MQSLQDWMTSNQVTLSDVARGCGVTVDTVSRWLSRRTRINDASRKAIRRFTQGQVDYPIPELAPDKYRQGFTLAPPAQSTSPGIAPAA